MSKKFQPNKDKFLQDLVKGFEDSLAADDNLFFQEEELEQLIDFYELRNDQTKALLVVERAVSLFPYSGAFYTKKAQILLELNLHEEAWAAVDKGVIFDPSSQELKLVQVDLHVAEGQINNAIELLEDVYDSVSYNEKVDVLLEFVDVYESFQHTEQVASILKRILIEYPNNEEAIHRFWVHCSDQDLYEDCIEYLKRNLDLNPYNSIAWYHLAKSYEEVGLLERASRAYEFSIAISEVNYVYWDYCLCLQSMKKYKLAIEHYYEMLSLFHLDSSIYMEIGHCWIGLSKYELAREAYTKVLDSTDDLGDLAETYFYIGKAFLKANQPDLALNPLKKATELKSKRTKYANALAKATAKTNQPSKALKTYQTSLTLKANQPSVYRAIAKLYFEFGQSDEVISVLEYGIRICQKNAKLHYHFAAYLFHYGFFGQGMELLEKALVLDSTKKNSIFVLFPELGSQVQILELMNQFE